MENADQSTVDKTAKKKFQIKNLLTATNILMMFFVLLYLLRTLMQCTDT